MCFIKTIQLFSLKTFHIAIQHNENIHSNYYHNTGYIQTTLCTPGYRLQMNYTWVVVCVSNLCKLWYCKSSNSCEQEEGEQIWHTFKAQYSYSTIMWWERKYWWIGQIGSSYLPMFYLPIALLPLIYSIGVYFNNLVLE